MSSDPPSFVDVARLIARDNPPTWLPELLRRLGLELKRDRELHESLPSKADLRRKLTVAKEAAEHITSLLNDYTAMWFVETESNMEIASFRLAIDLHQFTEALALAAAAPTISGTDGKARRGRGRAAARTALSSKSFCAAIIAACWSYVRGSDPAQTNKEAAAAARMYWSVTGGDESGWGSDPLAGWSSYFKEALSPACRSLRADLLQQCQGFAKPLEATRDGEK
jgi:hypothetical protein